jgi:hypothetical protein
VVYPIPGERLIAENRRYDFSQSFDVLVGPDKKKFAVHYDIIADRSGFLTAARTYRWNKDPQVPVEVALSGADPQEFSDYLQLVYASTIAPPDPILLRYYSGADEKEEDARLASESYFHMLARLYVLADKLEDTMSANLVMDHLLEFSDVSDFWIGAQTLSYIYDNTTQNSSLRMMVRDLYIYEVHEHNFDEDEPELPNEFLRELNKEHQRLRAANPEEKVEDVYRRRILDKFAKCHYHQPHMAGDPPCKGTKRR